MKNYIRQVLMYFSMGIGMAIIGLLLLPAGVLVMFISIVWRITDYVVRFLDRTSHESNGQTAKTEGVGGMESVIVSEWEER